MTTGPLPQDAADDGLEALPRNRAAADFTPVVLWGLLLLLVLAPFPLGSNRPWAWTPLTLMAAVLALGFAGALVMGRARLTVRPALFLPVALPWFAVMVWAAIQIWVPWPSAPGAALARSLAETASTAASIAVDAQLAQVGLMRLLAYGLVFFLAMQLARRRGGTTALLVAVAVAGIVAAAFAIFNHVATGSLVILGYQRQVHALAPPVGMSGPFVYPNAFGAYVLLAALAVAVLLARRARGEPRQAETLRERLGLWAIGRSGRNLPLSIALFVLLLAMAWTGSRSALLAGLGTMAVLLLGLALLGGRATLLPAAGAFVAMGIVALAAGSRVSSRLAFVDEGFSGRGRLVDQALVFVDQSPLLGWGLGAFRRLWPLVRGEDQFARFDEVHSTLVEFVLELGLPAAVLLLFAFAAMAATFLNALLLRRRSRLFAVFGLALLALALLHSVLDFTLQMPANAVTLLALLGLAYGRALPIDATGEGGGRRIRDAGR